MKRADDEFGGAAWLFGLIFVVNIAVAGVFIWGAIELVLWVTSK